MKIFNLFFERVKHTTRVLTMLARTVRLSTRYNSTFAQAAMAASALKNASNTSSTATSSTNSSTSSDLFSKLNLSSFNSTENRPLKTTSSSVFSKSALTDPLHFAENFIVQDKIAGRSVEITNKQLDKGLNQFNSLVRSNRLREISNDQKFYTKPNKRRLAKRIANRKKVFETGISTLFKVVKDAVRKGY